MKKREVSGNKSQKYTLWFNNPENKRKEVIEIFKNNSEIGQCPTEALSGLIVFEEAEPGQLQNDNALGWGTYYIFDIVDELNELGLNARLMKG